MSFALGRPFLGLDNMQTDRGKTKRTKKKRGWVILLALLLFVGTVLGFLQIGSIYTGKTWSQFCPDYEKVDLLPILEKEALTDEDYETLYRQTGLTKLGIDDLKAQGRLDRILQIQTYFFKKQTVYVNHFNPFTYSEEINDVIPMAQLRSGDILVTSTTRVSWLRYGHAALVVDGAKGMVIESISPGSSSQFNYATDFSKLANFMILRPNVDEEIKTDVVEFAKTELLDIPYRFTLGIFYKKFPESITVSQCAHLVWYAYKKFGYDLDATGGGVVKPQDMVLSKHVEVVQAYGFDLDDLWGKAV